MNQISQTTQVCKMEPKQDICFAKISEENLFYDNFGWTEPNYVLRMNLPSQEKWQPKNTL